MGQPVPVTVTSSLTDGCVELTVRRAFAAACACACACAVQVQVQVQVQVPLSWSAEPSLSVGGRVDVKGIVVVLRFVELVEADVDEESEHAVRTAEMIRSLTHLPFHRNRMACSSLTAQAYCEIASPMMGGITLAHKLSTSPSVWNDTLRSRHHWGGFW